MNEKESGFLNSIYFLVICGIVLGIFVLGVACCGVFEVGKEIKNDVTVLKIANADETCVILTDVGIFRSSVLSNCILFDVGQKYNITYLPWANNAIVGVNE